MGLLRKLFWFALFLGLTFCFIVLFEYGTKDYLENFPKNARSEYAAFQAFTAPAKIRTNDGTK